MSTFCGQIFDLLYQQCDAACQSRRHGFHRGNDGVGRNENTTIDVPGFIKRKKIWK